MQPVSLHFRQLPKPTIIMRTLLLAAAVLVGTTVAHAQAKSTTMGAGTPKSATTMTSPSSGTTTLADQKRAISSELKTTYGASENLLAKAMGMLTEATAEDHDRLMKITDGIKTVQADLNNHLGLVGRATEEDSKVVFANATEANASSQKMLDKYKTELLPTTK
jgi:hypothetical protein